MRHEEFMRQAMAQSDVAEIAGKEAYGNVDMVNSPSHYNQTGIECIHAISAATNDGFKYYLIGMFVHFGVNVFCVVGAVIGVSKWGQGSY